MRLAGLLCLHIATCPTSPPAQILTPPVDALKCDTWALGCVTLELALGSLWFSERWSPPFHAHVASDDHGKLVDALVPARDNAFERVVAHHGVATEHERASVEQAASLIPHPSADVHASPGLRPRPPPRGTPPSKLKQLKQLRNSIKALSTPGSHQGAFRVFRVLAPDPQHDPEEEPEAWPEEEPQSTQPCPTEAQAHVGLVEFLRRTLDFDPRSRLSALGAVKHPWLTATDAGHEA